MYPYQDKTLPIDERVNDLLGRMTLEEKTAQLACSMLAGLNGERAAEALPNGMGAISCMNTSLSGDTQKDLETLREVQRYLVKQTRLGIPALIHNEGLAGAQLSGATAFPQSFGAAASWDPELLRQAAGVVREQLLSFGIQAVHSPLFDLARDPRWGRVGETYGEDPYLTAQMGCAYVKGVQEGGKMMATAKHFVAYGAAEGGRNGGETQVGERRLLDTYCYPFEAAIHEAKIKAVMNAYGILNEEPIATSKRYLTDLLRDRLGFEGLLVADYGSISRVDGRYHTAADAKQAGIQALKAGIDVEQPTDSCYKFLAQAVRDGEVDEALIDRSVARVLEMKFRLGLFENPYAQGDYLAEIAKSESAALALKLAEESMTLVKNDGALPLAPAIRVALVGPAADDAIVFFGGYSAVSTATATGQDFDRSQGDGLVKAAYSYMLNEQREALGKLLGTELASDPTPEQKQVIFSILRQQMSAMGKTYSTTEEFLERFYPNCTTIRQELERALGKENVLYAQGCKMRGALEGGIEAAVEAAKQADVVVAVVGGKESMRAPDATCGENKDNTNIDLEPAQMDLMAALIATGKPVVTVILEGRALAAPAVQAGSAAVLYSYLPGQEGAKAIVRTLTGKNNPAGRLPMTVPKHTGQIPLYYSKLPVYTEEDQWGEYLFPEDNAPLYAFGHGLSYTTFEYSSLSADETISIDGVVHATFRVKNTGKRDGDEVVQIYVGHKLSSAVRPLRQLVGFRRVHLTAGAEKELRFAMELRQLAYHNIDMEQVVEPGEIRLEVGASSQDIRLRAAVEITGSVQPVARKAFHSTLEVC